MSRYRKKPVVIDAWQYALDVERPDWVKFSYENAERSYAEIDTLEGVMQAWSGDWIIRGVKGELYPCKSDIFEETYEVEVDT